MENTLAIVQQRLVSTYFRQFPEEAALTLESFPEEKILAYLSAMPAATAREVFSRLNPEIASELILKMEEGVFIQLFSNINTHLGARLLSRLNEKDIQHRLSLLSDLLAREMREFMTYQPDSAGYLMETTVTTFHADNSVQDVLERIRKLGDRRITTVYILNESGVLLGRVPLQIIAISQPRDKLSKLIQSVTAVNAMASREEVLQVMEQEKMLQIPVIDVHNHLLGIIRNDALFNATKQELTEDLAAMFGAGREERALSKVSFAVRKRLPWLQVNLATAFLASMVVGFFEATIAKITILAVFLPVVAGQSGNTGSQALAVTMRGLALREVRISQWFKVAKKEILVGLINGFAIALTTGTIVFFWASSLGIAIVIGISMVVSMVIAGFSGAAIPMALKAMGQDPATSSSIVLTTVTDICGFLSFLGLATALASVLGIT